jgi:hypothetical protein
MKRAHSPGPDPQRLPLSLPLPLASVTLASPSNHSDGRKADQEPSDHSHRMQLFGLSTGLIAVIASLTWMAVRQALTVLVLLYDIGTATGADTTVTGALRRCRRGSSF